MIPAYGKSIEHTWVLRLRPDLELHDTLPLPPQPVVVNQASSAKKLQTVYVPWACPARALSSDQWLILPAAAAAQLGAAYERKFLRAALAASSPPSMYPERLVWHVLSTGGHGGWHIEQLATVPSFHLIGADGQRRDPHTKLKRDFPSCFSERRQDMDRA